MTIFEISFLGNHVVFNSYVGGPFCYCIAMYRALETNARHYTLKLNCGKVDRRYGRVSCRHRYMRRLEKYLYKLYLNYELNFIIDYVYPCL